MKFILLEPLNLLPSPFDPLGQGFFRQIEIVRRAPARSVSENLAGIVGGFRRLRSSEGRRQSVILLWVSDDDFVIADRHSQTKVPVVRPPLEARLLDVHLDRKALSQFSVEPEIHSSGVGPIGTKAGAYNPDHVLAISGEAVFQMKRYWVAAPGLIVILHRLIGRKLDSKPVGKFPPARHSRQA